MRIIKGNSRLHEFVDNFIKNNNAEKFIVIDNKNSNYKYDTTNVLIFISNEYEWCNNIKTCLQEKEDRIFIFFTNTDFNNKNLKYFNEEFNYKDRNVIFIFNDDCENVIKDYEIMEDEDLYE